MVSPPARVEPDGSVKGQSRRGMVARLSPHLYPRSLKKCSPTPGHWPIFACQPKKVHIGGWGQFFVAPTDSFLTPRTCTTIDCCAGILTNNRKESEKKDIYCGKTATQIVDQIVSSDNVVKHKDSFYWPTLRACKTCASSKSSHPHNPVNT